MPSFEGSLSDEHIKDIIRFLHSAGPETHVCRTTDFAGKPVIGN